MAPNSWETRTLGDVLTEVNVRASDILDESSAPPVLSLTKNFGLILQSDRFEKRIATADVSRYKVVRKNWLVYNPYVLWEGAIHALRTAEIGLVSPVYHVWQSQGASAEFLDYLLKSPEMLNAYLRVAQGTVKRRRAVRTSSFKKLLISLPSRPEQRAIAHALDAVQKAKEIRRLELALERERKAALMEYLFTHGTRGEATKQTEVGEIPESWHVAKLGNACEFLQYGTSRRCDALDDGVAVLGIPNVVRGRINSSGLKFLRATEEERKKLRLLDEDLIFVRTNAKREYTGRCAVFHGEVANALFASYLIRARLKPQTLLPDFVSAYADTSQGKAYLSGRASNAADGKFNINTQTIRAVLIPQPQLEEQRELVAALSACDVRIASLEAEVRVFEELFGAVLEELIGGRLSVAPLIEEPQRQ